MPLFSLCCAQLFSHVCFFATPWAADCRAPLSMGILQAIKLEWVAFPFSKGSSQPRIEPRSPTLQADSLPTEALAFWPGKFQGLQRVAKTWTRLSDFYCSLYYTTDTSHIAGTTNQGLTTCCFRSAQVFLSQNKKLHGRKLNSKKVQPVPYKNH